MRKASMMMMTLIALAITAQSALYASTGRRQTKSSTNNNAWKLPAFHGLRFGASSAQDLIAVFGKPTYKQEVEETIVESDRDGEIEYEYRYIADAGGEVLVYFGKRSGMLSAILVYPKHMTRADALAQFGTDFRESNAKLGACPTEKERKLAAQDRGVYEPALIYPQLGLYITIGDGELVHQIAYQRSCR